jgi:hypothetical protein
MMAKKNKDFRSKGIAAKCPKHPIRKKKKKKKR